MLDKKDVADSIISAARAKIESSAAHTAGQTMVVTGGASMFTFSGVIQVIGAAVGIAGVIIGFLNVRANNRRVDADNRRTDAMNRANDLKEQEINAKAANSKTE